MIRLKFLAQSCRVPLCRVLQSSAWSLSKCSALSRPLLKTSIGLIILVTSAQPEAWRQGGASPRYPWGRGPKGHWRAAGSQDYARFLLPEGRAEPSPQLPLVFVGAL